MSPRIFMSTSLRAWTCPQCRYISTGVQQHVSPASPRFIPVPDTPQSSFPYPHPVRGTLPVPRDIFLHHRGKDKAAEEFIAQSTKRPQRTRKAASGSRQEWKYKLSEQRRENLKEGIKALKARKDWEKRRVSEQGYQRQKERQALVLAPDRKDERFTTPSHGLDPERLYKRQLEDPIRELRIADKTKRYCAREELRKHARMDSLHTLYTRARYFIVTPEQLETAIEAEFGSQNEPAYFVPQDRRSRREPGHSVWALGKPMRVQDMVNKAVGVIAEDLGKDGKYDDLNRQRIGKIAEALTGGRMLVAGEEEGKKPTTQAKDKLF